MPSKGDAMSESHAGTRPCVGGAWRVFLVLLASLAACLAFPVVARADDYEITQVDIDATVYSDGSMDVTEDRTYEFYDSFHGVYWLIPKGYNSSNGKSVTLTDIVGGVVTGGGFEAFEEDYSGSNLTVQLSDEGSNERLKIYNAVSDGDTVTYRIKYHVDGILTRWDDTSELYWKFVSDGWDVESQNVTCTVHLPVPAGQTVTGGDNVRAWGHGPLDGTVSFSGEDVVFQSPGVGGEEYAEARIAFPAEWLSDTELTEGDRLQEILSEEQAWANEANARRERARRAIGLSFGGGFGLIGLSVALAIARKRRYDQKHRPVFQDKYFRDVPTADHPAVLAMLAEYSTEPSREGMTAALMRLTDLHIAKLDKVTYIPKRRKRAREAYMLTKVASLPKADSGAADAVSCHKVDTATIRFFFEYLAPKMADKGAEQTDRPSVNFSEIEKYASTHASKYTEAYEEWSSVLAAEFAMRFEGTSATGKKLPRVLGVLACVAGFNLSCFAMAMGASVPLSLVLMAASIAEVVACFKITEKMYDLNEDALEVRAKTIALKQWLCDFTRLEEAVPTDVVLWNRLLVMAAALGVADKVVEQLKVALPQILDDPNFYPSYGWFYYGRESHLGTPADAVHGAVEHAYSVANTHNSSGIGGGGGFSGGGGGGGFGGGGGGGAF